MILGLGVDIVEISRIARSWDRFGARFARRVLHPDEIARMPSLDVAKHQFLASRFAVKEAAVKALGTGFSSGISPTDVCVVSLPSGQPELRLYGDAGNRMKQLGADKAHVSLSHGKETVAAVVIIEKNGA